MKKILLYTILILPLFAFANPQDEAIHGMLTGSILPQTITGIPKVKTSEKERLADQQKYKEISACYELLTEKYKDKYKSEYEMTTSEPEIIKLQKELNDIAKKYDNDYSKLFSKEEELERDQMLFIRASKEQNERVDRELAKAKKNSLYNVDIEYDPRLEYLIRKYNMKTVKRTRYIKGVPYVIETIDTKNLFPEEDK